MAQPAQHENMAPIRLSNGVFALAGALFVEGA